MTDGVITSIESERRCRVDGCSNECTNVDNDGNVRRGEENGVHGSTPSAGTSATEGVSSAMEASVRRNGCTECTREHDEHNGTDVVRVTRSKLWTNLARNIGNLRTSKYAQERGRKDMMQILQDGTITKHGKNRRMFDEDTIKKTVHYILHSDHVQLLSWGTKRLKVRGGEYTRFPSLTRKVSCEVMWRKYSSDIDSFSEGMRKLKRSKFIQIATALTKDDVKQRACVDYKLHALVYENATTLKRIIEDQVREKDIRKDLKNKLAGLLEFLKNSYASHLDRNSSDPYHNIKFGLGHRTYEEISVTSKCRECNSVFKFVDELGFSLIDRGNHIGKVLEQAKSKFELYMSHKVRENVQEERIREMFEWAKEGETKKRVVVFIELKMKVIPERLRETQLQYFGKDGMSWHGSAVFYKHGNAAQACTTNGESGCKSSGGEASGRSNANRTVNGGTRDEDSVAMFFVDQYARMIRSKIVCSLPPS